MRLLNALQMGYLTAALIATGISPSARAAEVETEKEWTLEAGSGLLISNVRSSELDGYTLVPAQLTAALRLDEDSPDEGIFRGYTEFLFRGTGLAIAHGPESRILGANFGPRYNFVQDGWRVEPFIESTVGFGFAAARGLRRDGHDYGLGQDFNFNFTVSGGARYWIDDTWYLRLAACYTHYSNAGLSEPQHENRAVDAFGPELSFGFRF